MDKKELWLRLRDYHFDHVVSANLWEQIEAKFGRTDASTKAFAHKLAIKLGWSKPFALLAVAEYKKFVYLGVVSDFVVTPPQVIDQVWHQHILFSKAYRSFCQEVIEHDFDHNPELVSLEDQTAVYNAQYHDTLELYKSEFGFDAPSSIWGTPKFAQEAADKNRRSKMKKEVYAMSENSYHSDTPLYQSFNDSESGGFEADAGFGGFGDGDGGGGGATGSWGDSSSDGGSDSGSSCSSGCSSCGGGGD